MRTIEDFITNTVLIALSSLMLYPIFAMAYFFIRGF